MTDSGNNEVRKFFNHYLHEVFPSQLEQAITAHNRDVSAHKIQIGVAVRTESQRLRLWIIGIALVTGLGGGAGLMKLFTSFAGSG